MIQISWSKRKRDPRRISNIWNKRALMGGPTVSPVCSWPLFACHHWASHLTSSRPLPLWMLVSTLIHVTCPQGPTHCSSRLWCFEEECLPKAHRSAHFVTRKWRYLRRSRRCVTGQEGCELWGFQKPKRGPMSLSSWSRYRRTLSYFNNIPACVPTMIMN